MLRWLRLIRRIGFECVTLICGMALAAVLWRDDEVTWSWTVLGLFGAAVAAGLVLQTRSGALALAWRCPRLDRAKVTLQGRDAPWTTLQAAEKTLATLELEAKYFAAFFDGAHRDVAQTARRAVEVHQLLQRAELALQDVPDGTAKQELEAHRASAQHELDELGDLLGQLRGRLVASTTPSSTVGDPAQLLRALEQRTGALGEALSEARGLQPTSVGDRT